MTAPATSSSLLEDSSEAYQKLVKKLKRVKQLERAQGVLKYDQMVFLPPQSAPERGAQLSVLAELIHEMTTDKELWTLLEQAEKDLAQVSGEDADASRLIALEKKSFAENSRVPPELAAKAAALSAKSYAAWAKAKQDNDFESYQPILEECFETAKEVASAQRENDSIPLYEQMLDQYEMGMSPTRIDDVFQQIQRALVPLIAKVLASSETISKDPLRGAAGADGSDPKPLLKEKQMNLCKEVVQAMGFSMDKGRMDTSVHPFTISFSPSDVRITSRFSDDNWFPGLLGTMHEGGHALYEQNLASSTLNIDTALSLGMHESQSLFWERHVGKSREFWEWATPKLKHHVFDSDDAQFPYSAEEVYRAVNHVSKSLIRVEADELTYPLHVILRYQVERDIVDGKLDVKDLPARWNQQMKEMLDVDVPTDREGCLQDVHWPSLAIGYFPTYLLGSSTAAQLTHYCRKDIPDFDEKLRTGDFAPLLEWLKTKVHQHGKRYSSLDALLEDQVGEKLNPQYFIDYLTAKYSELYKLG